MITSISENNPNKRKRIDNSPVEPVAKQARTDNNASNIYSVEQDNLNTRIETINADIKKAIGDINTNVPLQYADPINKLYKTIQKIKDKNNPDRIASNHHLIKKKEELAPKYQAFYRKLNYLIIEKNQILKKDLQCINEVLSKLPSSKDKISYIEKLIDKRLPLDIKRKLRSNTDSNSRWQIIKSLPAYSQKILKILKDLHKAAQMNPPTSNALSPHNDPLRFDMDPDLALFEGKNLMH
jgi:hypothetical protein